MAHQSPGNLKAVDRRTLLKASAQCMALSLLPLSWATALSAPISAIGALRLPNGQFALSALGNSGESVWTSTVSARCHGGCTTPDGNEIVLFERRPGWLFHVFESASGERLFQRSPESGEHFYGHAVFSLDGRYLYATASHFESGQGRVAVFDRHQNYQRAGTLALDGIGPHQLELSADGSQLIIALGGIRTHPDYDRIKLNLDEMDPALLVIDRMTGLEVSRHRPSDSQLSCRHLAVAANAAIYVACQYQGPVWHQPALVGRLHSGKYSEIAFPERLQSTLHNYLASIAVQPETEIVTVTAPRGGRVVVFDGTNGHLIRDIQLQDAAGVKSTSDGGFLVSSGTGEWLWLDPNRHYAPGARGVSPWSWDNHLF